MVPARRVPSPVYSSRIRSSQDDREESTVTMSPERISRGVVRSLKQEMSISVSPFATEEEFAVLEQYASGSAERLINTTLDRIELTTEIRRENAKTKRHIDTCLLYTSPSPRDS